jgi:hypothetical protein
LPFTVRELEAAIDRVRGERAPSTPNDQEGAAS